MTTAPLPVSAPALSFLYATSRCGIAACALLVYDWLLCLGQEIRFIWTWRSRKFTLSSLVYALSRCTPLISNILAVTAVSQMSDLSCRAIVGTGITMEVLGVIASSAFSALRPYALSNRSAWSAVVIIALALPPVVMHILGWFYQAPDNLPSPYNCSASNSLPPGLLVSGPVISRASQLAAELLVVGITWWYTFRSYRVRKGIDIGKTFGSLLLYNGSMYFLLLATLYVLDIMFASWIEVWQTATLLEEFIDPMAAILTCRFMLLLRQFDSTLADTTASGLGPELRERVASTVLQFGAQLSYSLPALIASFANPVHVDSNWDSELGAIVDDGLEGRGLDTAPEEIILPWSYPGESAGKVDGLCGSQVYISVGFFGNDLPPVVIGTCVGIGQMILRQFLSASMPL